MIPTGIKLLINYTVQISITAAYVPHYSEPGDTSTIRDWAESQGPYASDGDITKAC